jgi:CheY-like chemotaxis protein
VKKIVIADDEAGARELLSAALSGSGYHVVEAASGDAAINAALTTYPDLILLDIHMPGEDGFAVCARLRRNARFAETPIVALTAGVMEGERERALEAGFSAFLSKPISMKALRAVIKDLIAR